MPSLKRILREILSASALKPRLSVDTLFLQRFVRTLKDVN
jgi:hypothetical protein